MCLWPGNVFTQPIKILSIFASICKFWAIWYIVTSYNTMHVAEHHFFGRVNKTQEIFHYPTRGYSTTRLLSSLPYPTLPYPKLKNHYPSGPGDHAICFQPGSDSSLWLKCHFQFATFSGIALWDIISSFGLESVKSQQLGTKGQRPWLHVMEHIPMSPEILDSHERNSFFFKFPNCWCQITSTCIWHSGTSLGPIVWK